MMNVETFFDEKHTGTVTFVVSDSETDKCAVIDSVLHYDNATGSTDTKYADKIIKFIEINNLKLEWILETHIHADHLTASHYLKSRLGGRIGIGSGIAKVLEYWVPFFDACEIPLDGSQFDHLFKDGDEFNIGNIKVKVIHTPGHTPACITYYIKDSLFVGDTIFSPQVGTARTDFPGGSSLELFDSIQKLYTLPDATKVYVGHEYPEKDSNPVIVTSIMEEKKRNVSINLTTKKEEYFAKMSAGQINLRMPELILASLQINLNAGRIPQFVKIPVNKLRELEDN